MSVLFLIGRIILGLYFVYNGYNHIAHLSMMAGYAKSKGVPMASFAVGFSGFFIFLGGLSILFGVYPAIGLTLLLIFLIPVSFMMHSFWTIQEPMAKMGEMVNFMKNMALIGAVLMMYVISRPWPLSL